MCVGGLTAPAPSPVPASDITPVPGYPESIARLKAETRRLLDLADEVSVSVTEVVCREHGSHSETVIAVIAAGERPRTARVHKAVPKVTVEELAAAFGLTSHDTGA